MKTSSTTLSQHTTKALSGAYASAADELIGRRPVESRGLFAFYSPCLNFFLCFFASGNSGDSDPLILKGEKFGQLRKRRPAEKNVLSKWRIASQQHTRGHNSFRNTTEYILLLFLSNNKKTHPSFTD
jgi:hypothetical protein